MKDKNITLVVLLIHFVYNTHQNNVNVFGVSFAVCVW